LKVPEGLSWELVVVNNNSSDATADVINNYDGRLPIVYVFESRQGLSHARNAGLNKAVGTLLIFTDDDVRPCNDWLKAYWAAYQKQPVGFYWGGPVRSEFEVAPVSNELIQLAPCSVRGLDWGPTDKVLDKEKGEYFIAANWAVPSVAMEKVGGFNVDLGLNPDRAHVKVGEETDLMQRLSRIQLQPLYLANVYVWHYVPKEKTSVEHIASRVEANGRQSAPKLVESSVPSVFGVPRWVCKKIIVLWMLSLLKRVFHRNWYSDYMEYRHLLGAAKQILGK
jgi:glycosyltransferase involved in cell wall biosynthesis